MADLVLRRSFLVFACVVLCACTRPYQVGDYVLVEWGDDKLLYPAFILEVKQGSRFKVHFEGYPSRWDEVVALPRIKGRVEGKVSPPPPPLKVRLATGNDPKADGKVTPVSQFKEGDRIAVKWRESVYRAQVIEVVSTTELRVHYEGHETAWDEVVPVSRIVDQ